MPNNVSGDFSQALNQARNLFKQGKLYQALEQTSEILKLVPDDVRVLLLKGVIQCRRGYPDDACDLLGRVVLQVLELAGADGIRPGTVHKQKTHRGKGSPATVSTAG